MELDETLVTAKDKNGWTPLHEAVRAGDPDIVRFLIEKGADINSRTRQGGSVLYWALQKHDEDHVVIDILRSNGAKYFGAYNEEL